MRKEETTSTSGASGSEKNKLCIFAQGCKRHMRTRVTASATGASGSEQRKLCILVKDARNVGVREQPQALQLKAEVTTLYFFLKDVSSIGAKE